MPFVSGETVGSYRIIAQLGQGGMATVYKAYHAALDRYVALKVLHPAFLEDENFLARFQREARLVAKLEHPNIVPIYDFAEHEGQPYLVMKYIEGETLKARMARGPLSSDEMLTIIQAVGKGLSYAHRQGILHRDIKPSNVILAEDGGVYLADFGLARIAQGGSATLTSDMIIGTPQYIAPEQAMARKDLDERTDIYSLGVMLYELTVGQVPFSADTPFAVIHAHIYSPLPLPHELNPNVPVEIERVLLKALAKEREDRYESVDALVDAFVAAWMEAGLAQSHETMQLPAEALVAEEAPSAAPRRADVPLAATEAAQSPPPEPPETLPLPEMAAASTLDAGGIPSTVETAAPEARRKPWGWMAAGLILVFSVFFTLFLENRASPLPELTSPAPGMGNASPDAVFQQALALWHDEHLSMAQSMFRKAADLCGDDVDCILKMADDAYAQQIWPAAALFYGKSIPLLVDIPPEIKAPLDDAVFQSAMYPEMVSEADFIQLKGIDDVMAKAGLARYWYYQGERQKAYGLLGEIYNAGAPFWGPLLDLDFAVAEERWEDAKNFLAELENLEIPEAWVFEEMDFYREQIP